ncbi:MAG TPA: hypothetical protein VEF33_11265, partial [Syntrophales bacterium]|nr:hypothetical protein [Syntrophales bacterium]
MSGYRRFKIFCRKAVTPISIMFIPHDNPGKSLNLNVPVVGVLLSAICCFVGAIYIFSMIPDAIKYHIMEKQLLDYSRKVVDFNTTLSSLKKEEKDLYQLVSLGSKEKILEKVDTPDMDNRVNMVQAGKKIKQGDVIGYLSSTSSAAKN